MVSADRPLERRTAARTAVVWDALQPVLAGRGPCDVVDIGGGTGGFAVRLAAEGHRVTVVDPSPDALAAAARRADERGVADRVLGRQGDLGDLLDLVDPASADLVLCHGVLGIVPDARAAVDVLARVLRPGATLSLLVNQLHAAVIHRAMSGHLGRAAELLNGIGEGDGERRFTAADVEDLLAGSGLVVRSVHGVRVFTDLVPSGLLDLEPGAGEALLELERAVAGRPDYRTVASQLHVLAGS